VVLAAPPVVLPEPVVVPAVGWEVVVPVPEVPELDVPVVPLPLEVGGGPLVLPPIPPLLLDAPVVAATPPVELAVPELVSPLLLPHAVKKTTAPHPIAQARSLIGAEGYSNPEQADKGRGAIALGDCPSRGNRR
jgi:hypothetical protein